MRARERLSVNALWHQITHLSRPQSDHQGTERGVGGWGVETCEPVTSSHFISCSSHVSLLSLHTVKPTTQLLTLPSDDLYSGQQQEYSSITQQFFHLRCFVFSPVASGWLHDPTNTVLKVHPTIRPQQVFYLCLWWSVILKPTRSHHHRGLRARPMVGCWWKHKSGEEASPAFLQTDSGSVGY